MRRVWITLALALFATQAGAQVSAGTWLSLFPGTYSDLQPLPIVLVPSEQHIQFESIVGEKTFARAVAFSRDFPCTHRSWNLDPGPPPEPGKPWRTREYWPHLRVTARLHGKRIQICELSRVEACAYIARFGTVVAPLPEAAEINEQFACH